MKIRNKPNFAVEGLPLKPVLSIHCLPRAPSPFAASLELSSLEWEEFAVGFFRGFKMLILCRSVLEKEIQHQTRFQKNRLGI